MESDAYILFYLRRSASKAAQTLHAKPVRLITMLSLWDRIAVVRQDWCFIFMAVQSVNPLLNCRCGAVSCHKYCFRASECISQTFNLADAFDSRCYAHRHRLRWQPKRYRRQQQLATTLLRPLSCAGKLWENRPPWYSRRKLPPYHPSPLTRGPRYNRDDTSGHSIPDMSHHSHAVAIFTWLTTLR